MDGFAKVILDAKFRIINEKGQEVTQKSYDEILDFEGDFAKVELNGKWGIINKNGEEILPPKYDWIYYFDGYVAKVKKYFPYFRLM